MAFDYAKKVSALIAMAEDESQTPEARANYRAKAEELMKQYRIAEEELIATDQFAVVPVLDTIDVMETGALDNPLRGQYWSLFSAIAKHAGVRVRGEYHYGPFGTGANRRETSRLEATMVGYEGDIAYAKFIWVAARLVFMTRIDARINRSLSDQENAYYMRNSGVTRKDIATALWGSGPTDGQAHGKVQKLYMAECAKRGETPRVSGRGIQVGLYREAYADSFVNEFMWRLRKAKDAAGTSGGGLELHGRKDRVDEAFYKEFPEMRPESPEEAEKRWKEFQEAEANCEDCKKTKSSTGKCKAHRPRYMTAAEVERNNRRYNGPEAQAGRRAGSEAAQSVNLQRGFHRQEAAAAPEERGAIGR